MDSAAPWIVTLEQAFAIGEPLLGGKTTGLVRLRRSGLCIADGFCLTTAAYRYFVAHNGIAPVIALELGRKPLESMRWEELWDAALRIRSAFSKASIPADLAAAIRVAQQTLGREKSLAVRSSAPGEDSARASFAGMHESILDVAGGEALLWAVRAVWASLWSDAALLYRRELALDPATSSMAVLVQELVDRDVSGVAFSRDPANPTLERAILEAVPGRCSDLVDGLVEPDRWTLNRATGEVLASRVGPRESQGCAEPLLQDSDVRAVFSTLLRIESLTGDAVDVEWTGRGIQFSVLQARPISTLAEDESETRRWYLSLRPAAKRLKELSHRVSHILIPELEDLGHRFAAENLTDKDDATLADSLSERLEAVEHWRKVYWEDFIPFAHGVRQLALYYNDHVRPEDPYEFVKLLSGENLLAFQRNQRVEALVAVLEANPQLRDALRSEADLPIDQEEFRNASARAQKLSGGASFIAEMNKLLKETMDVTYGEQRLAAHPEHLLHYLCEMTEVMRRPRSTAASLGPSRSELERKFFTTVGPERRAEAEEILAIGRLSWRLRDDDNLLLARLEAQLFEALGDATLRLSQAGRLVIRNGAATEQDTKVIAAALRDPKHDVIALTTAKQEKIKISDETRAEKPRQLVGQPAAPGIATGLVRIITNVDDLQHFRAGDVLVCRAIEPTMTHLVPLARAIVELRGGMLIHGAIIARELGIPCVNGIPDVVAVLRNGELVTVDGYLGVVTVGAPEFDIEGVTLGRSDVIDAALKRI